MDAVVGIDEGGEPVGADHQHLVDRAGGQHPDADVQRVGEAGARRVEVERRAGGARGALGRTPRWPGTRCRVWWWRRCTTSTSAGSTPDPRSSASAPAATARSAVVWPGSAIRRSTMPVRSRIQASDVSRRASRSTLVTTVSGSDRPSPRNRAPPRSARLARLTAGAGSAAAHRRLRSTSWSQATG